MLKNLILGIVLVLFGVLISQFIFSSNEKAQTEEEATILLEQINEISKLMLVEGNFSEIYTYKQAEKQFFGLIPVEKKIIVLVKAKAYVGYDLTKLDFSIDQENKQIIIGILPKAEIILEPNIEYYDIQQSEFYKFNEADYNKFNKRAKDLIEEQVRASYLIPLAEKRVAEVLENLIFKSESMGWEIKSNTIDIEKFKH